MKIIVIIFMLFTGCYNYNYFLRKCTRDRGDLIYGSNEKCAAIKLEEHEKESKERARINELRTENSMRQVDWGRLIRESFPPPQPPPQRIIIQNENPYPYFIPPPIQRQQPVNLYFQPRIGPEFSPPPSR